MEADATRDDTRPTGLTSSDHTAERTVSNRTPQPNPSPRRAHVNDRGLIHTAAEHTGLDPDRISFTRTLQSVRRHASDEAAFSPR